jgi:predicted AAA+ superfamily ATPase
MEMKRTAFEARITDAFLVTPAVALLGPRQCGKTTLAKAYGDQTGDEVHRFDLEDPVDLARLENPLLTLEKLTGLIIIDEIQRIPDFFPVLRVLIDRKLPQKYLILGSASRDLVLQSSESLAGRLSYIELTPFDLSEVGSENSEKHLIRGGFPLSYLAENDSLSYRWRESYIRTFLERDIPALGIRVSALQLRRFWMMLAHFHGQIVNFADLGRSLDINDTTARSYLDILTGTFMIRELSPWFENIGKRQVKRPKIYFRDSGIFHSLLGIQTIEDLENNPKLGASWEGYALEETIRSLDARAEECFFWGVHEQAELDLLILKDGKKLGFEFKYKDAPTLSPSMIKSNEILSLDELTVVYPGKREYELAENIRVTPLADTVNVE